MDTLWLYAAGAAALLVATPLYRLYLRRRLFFPAWTNLSGDDSLNLGDSLSELFYSELQSVRRIHEQASADDGIWNARSNVPTLERSSDGYPWFVREARLVASNTPGLKMLSLLPSLGRSSQFQASIHKFGEELHIQLRIEGRIVRHLSPNAKQVFSKTHPANDLAKLPDEIRLLAYEVFMELTGITEFDTATSFRYFTQALHHHTLYQRFGTEEPALMGIELYEACLRGCSRSPATAYNLGILHYTRYTAESNQKALEYFHRALATPNKALQARAYAGLADAFSQSYQRWRSEDPDDLHRASRYAKFAWELGSNESEANRAGLAKAVAYTNYALSTERAISEQQRAKYQQYAKVYYYRAIKLNPHYAVALNNLGFLFLQQAKEHVSATIGAPDQDLDREKHLGRAVDALKTAKRYFQLAVNADRLYQHAYDNLGSVCIAQLRLGVSSEQQSLRLLEGISFEQARRRRAALLFERLFRGEHPIENGNGLLEEAERWFHFAVGLDPTYAAAFQDIANVGLMRSLSSSLGPASCDFYVRDSLFYHLCALKQLGERQRAVFCHDYSKEAGDVGLEIADLRRGLVSDEMRKELTDVGCTCVVNETRHLARPTSA